jgi:3-methyladenine DNA glycosylase/8-oxoguanine DNA glycosylase
MFLATGLKRWEVIPAGDLGLQRAVGEFCLGKERATEEEVRGVAEGWGEMKWPMAYYLLVASERKERLMSR